MGLLLTDTCLVDVAVLLATIVGLFYYWSICTFSYWERKGVKSIPNPLPLVGSMWPAVSIKRHFGLHFWDMYKDLEGEKFGGYYKFREPTLMIRDPILIGRIVINDFSHFTDNDYVFNEKNDPVFGNNLFIMKGDKWKYVRSKISPIFSSSKMQNMFPLMVEVSNELVAHIRRKIASPNPEFNAKDVAANFAIDNVTYCALGMKCNSFLDENNEIRKMSKAMMEPPPVKGYIMNIQFFWPKLSPLLEFIGIRFINDAVLYFYQRLVHDSMKFREENNIHKNDLIQLLMQLKKRRDTNTDDVQRSKNEQLKDVFEEKYEITDDLLTAQAAGFYIDGFETSSTVLGFAMHELAVNPHLQNKLRDELQLSMDTNGGELTYKGIQECAYLDQVIMETLRMYPVFGALSKACTKPYVVPDTNLRIDVGTSVSIPVLGLHYDPQYFPDPETFDPERFNEENKKNIVPHTYMPFGEGPRQCVGMRFGLMQIKLALAKIITNFELQQTENTKHPVTLDPHFFMVSALGGLPMKAVLL